MKGWMNWFWMLGLVVALSGCRTAADDETTADTQSQDAVTDIVLGDQTPQEVTGNERWIQPAGTAKITFFVDDRANQTFADGEMIWTGSFSWDSETNLIVFATSWLPTDGPFPLLYDDGPVADGGHEMEGSQAGDHIFSTEVYFKAEEETTLEFGVLNELNFWMWEGINGTVDIPAGSTDTFNAQGLELKPFGSIDVKVTVNTKSVNEQFGYVLEWDKVNVYVKGSMNMWAPVQVLDMGPDANKGDDAADDGIYTFVHGLNLGKHTGLLEDGQEGQFTVMFSQGDSTYLDAVEYKLLSGGVEKGVADGVKAYLSCDGGTTWDEADIVWRQNSWGNAENTAVMATCNIVPECTVDNDTCLDGEKCVNNKCVPWCDTDEECPDTEKCIDHECIPWCDVDGDCGADEVCIDNECIQGCSVDEDCDDGFECVDNQCSKIVVPQSEPSITSVDPDTGSTEGGTLVTVSGTDFQDGAAVKFGTLPGTNVVVLSATSLTCSTPAQGAGKVDVTVTNPDGGTDTYIKAFQYNELSLAPMVDSIEPTEGPVTGGTAVHLYGTNFLPSPTVYFGTNIASEVQFVDSTHVVATTAAGALGSVNVRIINSDEQEDTLAGAFTYVPNVADYVKLLPPLLVSTLANVDSEEVFVEVWEPGLTEGEGAASGISVEAGYGPSATPMVDWAWFDATYHGESGNNDVHKAVFNVSTAGDYAFSFRVTVSGGSAVYADSTGTADGFDVADAGALIVEDLGVEPHIAAVTPSAVSVVGGDTVTVTGVNFGTTPTVLVDGVDVTPQSASDDTITFVAPVHGVGAVDIAVTTGEGTALRTDGLWFVLKKSVILDGDLSDWPPEFEVATNTLESNWGANTLDSLHVAFDDEYLYVGVAGTVEADNYILGYIDVDFGTGTGVVDNGDLTDNGGNGDLDDALSNVLAVSVSGFGAEFGFGTQGMGSYTMGGDLGNSVNAGWREFAIPDNFSWLQGTVECSAAMCEAAIPLSSILPNIPSGGKTIALYVKVANKYGGFDGVSNQTLPEFFDPDSVEEVGDVVTVFVKL